jgi:hypothetical protein
MLGSPVNLTFIWSFILAAYGLIHMCVFGSVSLEIGERTAIIILKVEERENCSNYTENVHTPQYIV